MNHIESISVFQGISNDTQNDLIDSITKVIHEEIVKEIQKLPFVAIIVDETVDISNCFIS